MYEKINSAQLAIIFPNSNLFGLEQSNLISDEIREILEFQTQAQILPFNSDAPPEVPRVILKSDNNLYRFHIAASRIDIFLNNTPEELNFININQKFSIIYKVLSNYFARKTITVKRVGVVFESDLVEVDNKTDYIKDIFLNKENFLQTNLNELSFRMNEGQSIIINGKNINFNKILVGTSDKSNIKFQADINTSSDNMTNNAFSELDVEQIVNNAIRIKEEWNKRFFSEMYE